jgi:hypothetical protein
VTKTKVLYIMATGRSGTTILDNVLGSLPGFFSGGELHLIWKALLRRSGCGCGRLVADCDLWSRVIAGLSDHVTGGQIDPALFDRWRRSETRIMHTPRLLLTEPEKLTNRPVLARYSALLSDLYKSAASETGARVIVDSSKTPANVPLLGMMNDVDPYVVHVVRDPRAVAHSWQRLRPTFDPHRREPMHRLGPVRSSFRWLTTNLLAEGVRCRLASDRYLRLRYEDFIEEPKTEVARLKRFLEEEEAEELFIDDRTVLLNPNHTVWGNRSRFMSGEVTLRQDEEWIQQASFLTRSITSAVTLPLLLRYHYNTFPRPRSVTG